MDTVNGQSGAGIKGRIAAVVVAAALAGGGLWYFASRPPGPGPSAPAGRGGGSTPHGKAEMDLGFIEPGSRHEVSFVVDNPATRPLGVRRVRSECACMTTPTPPKAIPAGGGGEVKVVFLAPKESIDYAGKVVLETDSKDRPVIPLVVKARVGLPLEVSPAVVRLGKLSPGQTCTGAVVLWNRGRETVRPLYATAADTTCVAQVPRASIPPGGKLEIPILVKVSPGASGPQEAKMRIHTDCPAQETVDVSAEYDVGAAAARGS